VISALGYKERKQHTPVHKEAGKEKFLSAKPPAKGYLTASHVLVKASLQVLL